MKSLFLVIGLCVLTVLGCASNSRQLSQCPCVLNEKAYLLNTEDWHSVEQQLRSQYHDLFVYGDHITGSNHLSYDERNHIKEQALIEIVGILNNCPINLRNYHLINCIGCWFKTALENSDSKYYKINEDGNYFFELISSLSIPQDSLANKTYGASLLEELYYANPCKTSPEEIVHYRLNVLNMIEDNWNQKSNKCFNQFLANIQNQEDDSVLVDRIRMLYR